MFILVTEKNYPPSGGFSSTKAKNHSHVKSVQILKRN
jgi:hypothetical protein